MKTFLSTYNEAYNIQKMFNFALSLILNEEAFLLLQYSSLFKSKKKFILIQSNFYIKL